MTFTRATVYTGARGVGELAEKLHTMQDKHRSSNNWSAANFKCEGLSVDGVGELAGEFTQYFCSH